ncbi:MAG: hypothetical protein IT442_12470 [Phycisphaeraceae bacterium]|nr:hypothetical protein [Phycisphaeraceae bacterium]
MAGDPFKKVRPGETLTIPAAAYNAMLDAAMSNRQGQAMGAGPGPGSAMATPTSTTVLIKNNSGVARNQFDVLGIDGALFDPATALESFKRQVVLKGVVPTADHTGKFVVLQEPARVGGIARACLLGATVARVNVTTESLTYADVLASDATKLQTVSSGKAAIVWKQTGTGVKWAIVALGGTSTVTSDSGFWAVVISSNQDGAASDPETVRYVYTLKAARPSNARLWEPLPGATEFYGYNTNEWPNPTIGGIAVHLMPVVNNAVVWVRLAQSQVLGPVHFFYYANDIECV